MRLHHHEVVQADVNPLDVSVTRLGNINVARSVAQLFERAALIVQTIDVPVSDESKTEEERHYLSFHVVGVSLYAL